MTLICRTDSMQDTIRNEITHEPGYQNNLIKTLTTCCGLRKLWGSVPITPSYRITKQRFKSADKDAHIRSWDDENRRCWYI